MSELDSIKNSVSHYIEVMGKRKEFYKRLKNVEMLYGATSREYQEVRDEYLKEVYTGLETDCDVLCNNTRLAFRAFDELGFDENALTPFIHILMARSTQYNNKSSASIAVLGSFFLRLEVEEIDKLLQDKTIPEYSKEGLIIRKNDCLFADVFVEGWYFQKGFIEPGRFLGEIDYPDKSVMEYLGVDNYDYFDLKKEYMDKTLDKFKEEVRISGNDSGKEDPNNLIIQAKASALIRLSNSVRDCSLVENIIMASSLSDSQKDHIRVSSGNRLDLIRNGQ